MITVYVIESLKDQIWYTGMAKDVNRRLKDHNSGKNRFTKGHIPWKIVYTELFENWSTARQKEKYLKTTAGKKWLIKQLNSRTENTGSLPD